MVARRRSALRTPSRPTAPSDPAHVAQALAPVRADGDHRPGAVVRGRDAAAAAGCRAPADAAQRTGGGAAPRRRRRRPRRCSAAAGSRAATARRPSAPRRRWSASSPARPSRPRPARRGSVVPLLLRRPARSAPQPQVGLGSGVIVSRRRLPADQQPRGRGRRRHRGAAGRRPPGHARSWSAPTRRPTWRCCKIELDRCR